MKIEKSPLTSYWQVDKNCTIKFLGSRKFKDKDYILVENNVVNRILLNIEEDQGPLQPLLHLQGLEPFQVRDVIKMTSQNYVLNRNRMGYGKTVESIYAMRNLNIQNAIIVVPKPIMLQWKTQIDYWWPNNPGVCIFPDVSKPIMIVNYEKLLNTQNLTKFKSVRWDLIIADEAHRLKNRKSKTSIAIKSIPASRKWALTGTPILRKVDDMFSILEFLSPEYSGKSYWNFIEFFCEIKEGFFGREIVGLSRDPEKEKIWLQLMDKVSIYNPEMNLTPGKIVNTVLLDMDKKQRTLYNNIRDIILEELPEDLSIPNGAVLCTRLQQVTSNPSILPGYEKLNGIKFEYIQDVIENNPDEKFVVFTKFAKTAKNLVKFLNVKSSLYIGEMNSEERHAQLLQFQRDPQTRVFVATIGAAGIGLDGLQHVSRQAICLERDWSPEIMKQVEDRLNRPGQHHVVQITILECAHTYDQKVGKINVTKAEDIRRALVDE